MSRRSLKLGRRIKDLRLDRGLSQLELAEEAGLDVTTINELENGHRTPLITTLKKISKALSSNLNDLLT